MNIAPQTSAELAAALAEANARGQAVVPRGGGSKAEWGNAPVRDAVTLSTEHLNRVIDHAWADMTVTVEAGCTIGALQTTLAEHGQRLAIDPLWPQRATIGGMLATNDSGALRLRFGGLRDLIIGITVALPDGTLASSGGRVVKNVAGYDLPKLMTGSLGTLGVITQAVFRLHPVPRTTRTMTLAASMDVAQKLMLAIQDSQLAHSAMQIRAGGRTYIDVLFEGTDAGIEAQAKFLRSLGAFDEGPQDVWAARENLWPPTHGVTIAKFSVLPSRIAQAIDLMEPAAAVAQAHGIGYAKLTNDLSKARADVEGLGGSLTMLTPSELDAWGSAGTALGVMRAVKRQFDPHNILNPGRFVGGI